MGMKPAPGTLSRWGAALFPAIVLAGWLSRAAKAADDPFTLRFTPYAWLAGTNGEITVRGIDASVDASFTDVLGDTDSLFGLFGRIEGRKGRLGFYVDGGYVRVGLDDVDTPLPVRVDAEGEIGIVDFGLKFELGSWHVGGGDDAVNNFTLEALVGGRYTYVGLELDFRTLLDLSADRDWVDPTVGLQAEWRISPHWAALARGDVGGFGAASDFTWSAAGYLAYVFPVGSKVEGAVFVGYKAIGEQYETDSGPSEFEWDTVLHGPVIGLTFKF